MESKQYLDEVAEQHFSYLNPLREQTFNKFIRLGCLQQLKTVPNDIVFPRVAYVKHGIKSAETANAILDQANVVITTASALSRSAAAALISMADKSTHLFIDEAHHTKAPTWSRLKELFDGKPILQFTATPFRSDGKKIEGAIIYDYPLGLAQKNGYFREIKLIKIDEPNDEQADEEIAKRTIAALEADLAEGLDHIVMVRAKTVSRAQSLLHLYQEVGSSHRPVLMHYGLKSPEKKAVYDQLHSRETRVIVCVNMLGEGYDLPNLKLAAIHDIHKNLTTTLQFVGRFTRTSSGDDIGNASVIVNTSEPRVSKELEDLYAEDPDWNKLLREKSETAVREEIRLQEILQEFRGDLNKQVSLWNLRPSFSAFVYKTKCKEWSPNNIEEALSTRYKKWFAINQSEKILVLVINKEDEVKWGRYKDIKNLIFDLCVVYWDRDAKRLMISCSDYDVFDCSRLARAICGEEATIIDGAGLFNIFSEMNYPMVRNLGAKQVGSISFTMYFGSEVTTGLSSIDKADSIPNNIFAWGYEGGNMVTYGCSARSGKIWSQGGGSIVEWKDWCLHVLGKVLDPNEVSDETVPEIVREFLRPIPLTGRHSSVAIAAEWGQKTFQAPENKVYVYFGDDERSLFEVSLDIVKHSDAGPIYLSIASKGVRSEYAVEFVVEDVSDGTPRGKCTYRHMDGPDVFIRRYSGDKVGFEEYMEKDAVVIRYTDGSFSYGNYHVATPSADAQYSVENLETITWTADLKIESEGPERNDRSIQYQVIESIKDDYEIVINDDGSYEVADIIGLRRDGDDSYEVHLMHCKFSHTDNPSGDIRNLYDVCGQAQKCVQWKHAGFDVLADHIKRRDAKWKANGNTRFIKGTLQELSVFRKFARRAKQSFKVSIFQPGLSKTRVGIDITHLLASTENYLIKTSEAPLKIVCSE